jgi:hypothetical protein
LRVADGKRKLVLDDVAVNGEYAESDFVLTRYKRLDSNGDSFWIVGIHRDVVQIHAVAPGVDHSERRETSLQALTEPQLNLRR